MLTFLVSGTALPSVSYSVSHFVLAILVQLSFAHYSDKLKLRSPFVFASQVPIALVGFIINIPNASSGVKYFGTLLCVVGSYVGLPVVISWLTNNLGGRYKPAVGMAIPIGLSGVGGAVVCNIYRAQDAPRYLLGDSLAIVLIGLGISTLPVTGLVYKRVNAEKDRIERLAQQGDKHEGGTALRIGDRALGFRYTL